MKTLKRGFASSITELSPGSDGVKDWVEKTRRALGDSLDDSAGVILELHSVIAVFDERLGDVSGRIALPLVPGTRPAGKYEVDELPACEVIELRYPGTRTAKQVFADVYEQAIGYSEKSKKRDMGGFLRFVDRRGTRANAGFVVQLETVPRVEAD
ncbi:MAG: hypothetical protein HY904_18240 [Deltaproteobacteria bacterium]|nr:hypothetical protein [Deltaproteobacteria bacterium]